MGEICHNLEEGKGDVNSLVVVPRRSNCICRNVTMSPCYLVTTSPRPHPGAGVLCIEPLISGSVISFMIL